MTGAMPSPVPARSRAISAKDLAMPRRSATLLAIVLATVLAGAIAPAGRAADPADDAAFDRVFESVYTDLLFVSKTAYQGKRYDEAFPLMKKASCAGDKESQWMLGHMYLLGQGVDRDDFTGYAWIKVAAEFNSS